eukprot:m.209751 g.209751  ORF g.209751 m.209751 type:complete len:260 (+) comp17142_c0_seq42:1679-2458(+)
MSSCYIVIPYRLGYWLTLVVLLVSDDVTESNLRSAAFEALSASVQFAPTDCYPMVLETTNVMLQRLQACGSMPINSQDDLRQYAEIVSGLISTVSTAVRRLNVEEVRLLAPTAIQLLLEVLASDKHNSSSVVEDALICLDAFVEGLKAEIAPYVERMKPLVLASVNQVQHGSTCFAAVGIIGDLCRQLQRDSEPYCNDFMDVLLRALTADNVARSVKPAVLSAFNDMALALGTLGLSRANERVVYQRNTFCLMTMVVWL